MKKKGNCVFNGQLKGSFRMDKKIRDRLEAKEESYSLYRDKKRLNARLDLERSPPVGSFVEVITIRSKKADFGEQGTIFWKGISDFNNEAVIGVKITEERKVYLAVSAIKQIKEPKR